MPTWKDYKRFGEQFLDEIIRWIVCNLKPEDVFNDKELSDWAEANGYKKEE